MYIEALEQPARLCGAEIKILEILHHPVGGGQFLVDDATGLFIRCGHGFIYRSGLQIIGQLVGEIAVFFGVGDEDVIGQSLPRCVIPCLWFLFCPKILYNVLVMKFWHAI